MPLDRLLYLLNVFGNRVLKCLKGNKVDVDYSRYSSCFNCELFIDEFSLGSFRYSLTFPRPISIKSNILLFISCNNSDIVAGNS